MSKSLGGYKQKNLKTFEKKRAFNNQTSSKTSLLDRHLSTNTQ